MKKIFIFASICASLFPAILAEQILDQAIEKQECKKVSPSTVLQGIANSCNQLSKVAGANNKKEKQKETCGLIASFFQLAADTSKENEQSKKNKDQNSKNQPDAQNVEEKKVITDEAIGLVLGLANIINSDEQTENMLRSESNVYLSLLKSLPNDESRREIIEQILNDKEESKGFLEEVINSFNKIVFVSIPEISNELLDRLKNIF